MKFQDTALYSVLMYPIEEWEKNCFYIFLLKTPVFLVSYTIGIAIAVVLDCINLYD